MENPIMWKLLAVLLALAAAGPAWADTLLTYEVTAPELPLLPLRPI